MVISHSVLPRIFRLVVGFELAFTQYIHVPNTISIAYTIIHVYVLREWWLIHKIHVLYVEKALSTISYYPLIFLLEISCGTLGIHVHVQYSDYT